MAEENYNFNKIENKWQENWFKQNLFQTKKSNKEKYYILEMFPYPSGAGLHMGHSINYTIGDIRARFLRMNNYNVLYPMGYDSFGLPAENAAIKAGEHPKSYTKNSINNFIEQQKALGLSYDWNRTLSTCEPEYYKWNQYFFLKLYEKGLAYQKKAPVNWCSKCQTVLANEQVHNGKCWRHEDTDVEIKYLKQWFIKTTAYSDELLDVDSLEWPERIKLMQKNWIGRSEGTEIYFEVEKPGNDKEKFPVFTTRPDTLFGVTFMVISAQHENLMNYVTADQEKEVKKFLKKLKSVSEKQLESLEKEGIFTGSYAINPINNEKVPIYAGNFVVAEYGSGMVMAVPAHDQRDFEFAKKYNIPIKVVITPENHKLNPEKMNRAYDSEGVLVNSGEFNGFDNQEAKKAITEYLEENNLGKNTVQYKLRDWLVSRQRYWGTPIPFIYCNKCGVVPVPKNELPVKLPDDVEFGKGNPLETNKDFVNVKCPNCNAEAKRETDTMDTFFDSSWYFLRYCDNKNDKKPFDSSKAEYWMPVDQYIGGAEHATMHLLYARFFTKALRDLGFVDFNEPFKRLFNQGMLHASDGQKMSKSLGNVINPLDIIKDYGADSLRLALMSFASPDKDTNWDEKVLNSSLKFLNKVYDYFSKIKFSETSEKIQSKLNKTIKEFTSDIWNFKYNLAIIKIRELFNSFKEIDKETAEKFLILLHPFCPHLTEELWEKIGNNKSGKDFLSLQKWPKADESKIDEKYEKQEQAIEKLVDDINNIAGLMKEKKQEFNEVYVYVIPNEKEIYEEELEIIKKKTGLKIQIFSVSDPEVKSGKKDPEGKAKKAKPGKPAVYFN